MSAPTWSTISRVAQEARDRDLAVVAAETARDRHTAAVDERSGSRRSRMDTWSPSELAEWRLRIATLEYDARRAQERHEHLDECAPCRSRWDALAWVRERVAQRDVARRAAGDAETAAELVADERARRDAAHVELVHAGAA